MFESIKNTKLIFFIIIIANIILWFITYESIPLTRDEQWYFSYAIDWDDSQTNSIRHITEQDIHQIGFLPLLRIIQKGFTLIFGEGILGMRSISLIGFLISLFSVYLLFKKTNYPNLKLIIFSLLLHSNIWTIRQIHEGRPEYLMISLGLFALVYFIKYYEERKKHHIIISLLAVSISAGIYWSGLALVGGLFTSLFYLIIEDKANRNKNIIFLALGIVFLFLFFGSQIIYHSDLFRLMSSNPGSQVNDMDSNLSSNLITNFYQIFKNSFSGSLGPLSYLPLIIALIIVFFKVKKIDKYLIIFILFYFLVSAVRGPGARFFYMFLNIFFFVIIWRLDFNKTWRSILVYLLLIAHFIPNFIVSIKSIIKKQNTLIYYQNYCNDIKKNVSGERALVTFTTYLGLRDINSFQIENFIFHDLSNEFILDSILQKNNVNIICLDQNSNDKLTSDKLGAKKNFYTLLPIVLKNSFKLRKIIENRDYIYSKNSNYKSLKTEIWERRNLSKNS